MIKKKITYKKKNIDSNVKNNPKPIENIRVKKEQATKFLYNKRILLFIELLNRSLTSADIIEYCNSYKFKGNLNEYDYNLSSLKDAQIYNYIREAREESLKDLKAIDRSELAFKLFNELDYYKKEMLKAKNIFGAFQVTCRQLEFLNKTDIQLFNDKKENETEITIKFNDFLKKENYVGV